MVNIMAPRKHVEERTRVSHICTSSSPSSYGTSLVSDVHYGLVGEEHARTTRSLRGGVRRRSSGAAWVLAGSDRGGRGKAQRVRDAGDCTFLAPLWLSSRVRERSTQRELHTASRAGGRRGRGGMRQLLAQTTGEQALLRSQTGSVLRERHSRAIGSTSWEMSRAGPGSLGAIAARARDWRGGEMAGGITHGEGQVAGRSRTSTGPRSIRTAGNKFKRTSFWCRHGVGGELACLMRHSACRWRSAVARRRHTTAPPVDFPTSSPGLLPVVVNVCPANRLQLDPRHTACTQSPHTRPHSAPTSAQLCFPDPDHGTPALNGHREPRKEAEDGRPIDWHP